MTFQLPKSRRKPRADATSTPTLYPPVGFVATAIWDDNEDHIRISTYTDAVALWENGFYGSNVPSTVDQLSSETLAPEEAMFLCLLDVLRVRSSSGVLSAELLWRRLVTRDAGFVVRYVGYHYYRSKGWVVRCGTNYGGHYVLYKEGPTTHHSTYVVKVVASAAMNTVNKGLSTLQNAKDNDIGNSEHPYSDCDDEMRSSHNANGASSSKNLDDTSVISSQGPEWHDVPETERMTWTDLAGHCRVLETVNKDLVICHVTLPGTDVGSDLTRDQSTVLSYLKQCSVKEVLVRRWVPRKDRE